MVSREQQLKPLKVWGTVLPQKVWASLLITTSLFLTACSTTVPMAVGTLAIQKPSARLAATVGIYYAPEFHHHEEHVSKLGVERYDFPLGAASVNLFEQVMPLVFEKVMPIQSRPQLAVPAELDGVIEPRIESSNFNWGSLPIHEPFSVEISYRVLLYDKTGIPVISWVVEGRGEKPAGFMITPLDIARRLGEAADLALQDVARKFLHDFPQQPEVNIWLQKSLGRAAQAK